MGSDQGEAPKSFDTRVISLANAPGEKLAWDRPAWLVYLWAVCERVIVTNSWQVSSRLRVAVLKAFGAEIGRGVIFRPRTRVMFPWKLHIGDNSWIGEGVWFHNQDHIHVGCDVVISQETFLTTGSHAYRRDMALITKPIQINDGAWITSRCVILGGSILGISSVIEPLSVLKGETVGGGERWGGNPATRRGQRFESHE